jgi:tRNA pseudouridine38-40 synthase
MPPSEAATTTRYALWIEYDGTEYHGSQSQASSSHSSSSSLLTVQSDLEAGLGKMVSKDGTPAKVVFSGRTDAGVHAIAAVVHVDLPRAYEESVVLNALNHTLPASRLGVIACRRCSGFAFHAQRSALERTYVYRIRCFSRASYPPRPQVDATLRAESCPSVCRRGWLSVVRDRHRAWCVPEELDLELMRAAAAELQGMHDFSSFCSPSGAAGAQPVRELRELSVREEPADVLDTMSGGMVECARSVAIVARSRAFLKKQVRRIVAALVDAGNGRLGIDELRTIIKARDPSRAPPPAPAHGLYLARIEYPAGIFDDQSSLRGGEPGSDAGVDVVDCEGVARELDAEGDEECEVGGSD